MRIINLDNQYSIVCNTKNTRNGFKHVATLHSNGFGVSSTKICYLNRTWERFTYESIAVKMISEHFEGAEKEKYLDVISKENWYALYDQSKN